MGALVARSFYLPAGFVGFYLLLASGARAHLSFFSWHCEPTWFTQRCRLSLLNDVNAAKKGGWRFSRLI